MARQGRAVPLEQPGRLPLGHARLQSGERRCARPRGLACRPLERRQLLDLVDDAQSVAGVDEQVGGVLDPTRSSPVARRSSSTRKDGSSIISGCAYVFQPTVPTRHPVVMPSDARISDSAADGVAWLAGQAEVLEPDESHRQRRGPCDAVALVADEERRIAARPDDEHRLLEPRVEPGEVGEVGAVLPIAPHDQMVVPARSPSVARSAPTGRRRPTAGTIGSVSGIPKSGSAMSASRAVADRLSSSVLLLRATAPRRAPLGRSSFACPPATSSTVRSRRRATGRGRRPDPPRRGRHGSSRAARRHGRRRS